MSEPIAYLNGKIVPASELAVSVVDQGFLLGITVAEQLRTFGGTIFRLDAHLRRMARSLEILGVAPPLSDVEVQALADQIVSHNHNLLEPGDDLGLTIFVTPGVAIPGGSSPTVCLHTRPLPFSHWARKYADGERLATTEFEQVSTRSWPAELKCRSRVHYYLADRQAAMRHPGSRALMLDDDGFATEATTANILIFRSCDGLLTPPRVKILPGISLATLRELASELSIPVGEADLRVEDVAQADEVLLCSTSPCVLPVTQLNGRPISNGQPGDVFRQLLAAWSRLVGRDIAAQAERFANR